MRKVEDIMPNMCELGRVLVKYSMIERRAFDFGVGMDLYPAEIHTISTINRMGPSGVNDIALESGVTKGAVSQLVTKLVKKGLLEKESDPENGARVIVKLTSLGKKASKNHHDFHLEHDQVFINYLRSMDDKELSKFDDLCVEMNKWMDNYSK
ncbi:MarR family winged helix-turn-helix transcriptional regulator [Desulfovibrio sp. UCD-KL4C]|uniref:MarR family winged helix-turn-helix transcriptional regulator n=1 Tax=Desulfovibrio sp. UCD-KL4C TaxID=2578120 RepID=UPI0025C12C7E|nr:MarR family winged helix-turn-helix transcriptional regulator [Desulfovibrio sp. UCD-KL4C]